MTYEVKLVLRETLIQYDKIVKKDREPMMIKSKLLFYLNSVDTYSLAFSTFELNFFFMKYQPLTKQKTYDYAINKHQVFHWKCTYLSILCLLVPTPQSSINILIKMLNF